MFSFFCFHFLVFFVFFLSLSYFKCIDSVPALSINTVLGFSVYSHISGFQGAPGMDGMPGLDGVPGPVGPKVSADLFSSFLNYY